MLRLKLLTVLGLASAISTLSACSNQPPAVNAEPAELNVWSEPMNCYTGSNVIDGQKVAGTLCATRDYGSYGAKDSEPEIFFIPNDEQPIKQTVSDANDGAQSQWQGKKVLFKCDETLGADYKTVIKRLCRVSINDQPLVSAHINYVRDNESL